MGGLDGKFIGITTATEMVEARAINGRRDVGMGGDVTMGYRVVSLIESEGDV